MGVVQSATAVSLLSAIAPEAHPSSPSPWSYAFVIGLSLAAGGVDLWLFVRTIRSRHSGGDDEDDAGGGGLMGPSSPSPRPSEDPDWWPEFERQFGEYASRPSTRTAERRGAKLELTESQDLGARARAILLSLGGERTNSQS